MHMSHLKAQTKALMYTYMALLGQTYSFEYVTAIQKNETFLPFFNDALFIHTHARYPMHRHRDR